MTVNRSLSSLVVYGFAFLIAVLLCLHQGAQAQDPGKEAPVTLTGFVANADDGEPLAGAHIAVQHVEDSSVVRRGVTDRDGIYLVPDLPLGRYRLQVSFVGYSPHVDTVRFASEGRYTVHVDLVPREQALEEVVVEEEAEGATDLVAGHQRVQPAEIERIPTPDLGGDLSSYLTVLPGVVTMADRGGQLFIRGGEPSQNLMLLDGMILYQPFHMLGFYSAFPAGIINHTDFHSGGYGARYGRRLSSVIDVAARTGNKRRYAGSVSLSPFIGEVRLEGPIGSDRVSGLVSARRSTLEHGAETYLTEDLPFAFGDVFGKIHGEVSENSRLSVSAIRTFDRGTLHPNPDVNPLPEEAIQDEPFGEVRWQNWGVGTRYVTVPPHLPVVTDLHVSFSGLRTELGPAPAPARTSSVQTTRLAFDATFPGDRTSIQTGFLGSFSRFSHELGGLYQSTFADELTTLDHIVLYGEPEVDVGGGLRVRPGLRLQFLQSRFQPFVVPRLRMIWERGPHQISAAGGVYYQEAVGLSDRRDAATVFTAWTNIPKHTGLPRDDVRRGQTPRSIHGVVGYAIHVLPRVELSLEGFYKDFSDLFIAEWTAFPRFTTRLQPADGRSFGAEARLEMNVGPVYGYLGYGYSNTLYDARQSELELWSGTEALRFRPPHDRRHQVSALVNVDVAGFDLAARWQFGSGRPYSRIAGFDGFAPITDVQDAPDVPGSRRVIYAPPFDDVLPTYHRLDVSLERSFSLSNTVDLAAQASVVNVYDRGNIFFLDTFTLERVDQLPVTPSLGLSLRYR